MRTEETFVQLAARNQIVLRYDEDVNGSLGNVAGVINERGNVMGLMPHPEHAVDPLLGSADGGFCSKLSSTRQPSTRSRGHDVLTGGDRNPRRFPALATTG